MIKVAATVKDTVCGASDVGAMKIEGPVLRDRNGRGIFDGDRVKGLFLYGSEIIGVCEYSAKDAAWGLRWMRGDVEEFTPFCACCNVEWEVVR